MVITVNLWTLTTHIYNVISLWPVAFPRNLFLLFSEAAVRRFSSKQVLIWNRWNLEQVQFCNINRKTSVWKSCFNKLQKLLINFISTSSQKRLQHMWLLWKLRNCYKQLFLWTTSYSCFCQFEKVTVYGWASGDLLFLIKNKIVSTEKVCRSGQSMLFTYC